MKEALLELKQQSITSKELRKFGLVISGILSVIAIILYYKGSIHFWWIGGFGILFLTLGLISPTTLKHVYKLWMGFAIVLGHIVSSIILSLIFYLVITPMGIVLRILGKDYMNRSFSKKEGSYWIKKGKREFNPSSYEKMY